MSTLTTISTVAMLVMAVPGILVGAVLTWAIGRNIKARVSGQPLPYPTHFNISEFGKAVAAAFTGNIDAMKMAFDRSVDIQFKQGDRLSWMMDAVLDEWVARSKNPAASMPAFDAVVQWSGVPREALVAMVEHELRSRKIDVTPAAAPAPSPAIPAVAAALVLLLCSIGQAQSPMAYAGPSHWHADVRAPQSFRPTYVNLFAEPKVTFTLEDGNGNIVHQKTVGPGRVLGPNEVTQATAGMDAVAPGCQAGGYYGDRGSNVGFWTRGPVRRWISRGPVRRWLFRGRC